MDDLIFTISRKTPLATARLSNRDGEGQVSVSAPCVALETVFSKN